jgi:hypothetical protein
VHMCIYHASHGHRTCTYVVHALCDVSAFPTSVLFLRAFPTLLHKVFAFPTLFTEGPRAKPEKKWGALGACHALNALNARIFFSRCCRRREGGGSCCWEGGGARCRREGGGVCCRQEGGGGCCWEGGGCRRWEGGGGCCWEGGGCCREGGGACCRREDCAGGGEGADAAARVAWDLPVRDCLGFRAWWTSDDWRLLRPGCRGMIGSMWCIRQ